MLLSHKRLLHQYLKDSEHATQNATLQSSKRRLKHAIEQNKPIPQDLRNRSDLIDKLDLEDDETLKESSKDDEYRMAGHYEPKILITTSTSPSAPTVRFAKELKLLLPGSERINRGQTNEKDLMELCRREEITDLVEVGGADGEGRPTQLKICHLPFGPTASFTLSNILMRSDLDEKPRHMTQATPNLIFHDFDGKIGKRICSILKHVFPLTSSKSTRLITFANIDDMIYVRQYSWKKASIRMKGTDEPAQGLSEPDKASWANRIELEELGPRFALSPFKIQNGTIENKNAPVEWAKRSFINRAAAVL